MAMRNYTITAATSPPPLSAAVKGTPWEQAEEAAIDQFPWYKSGDRQATTARMLYDASALYVQFVCEDRHIEAEPRELNSSVCRDSCVELFATVDPGSGPDYFNFEANCCGAFHLGFGPCGGADRKLVTPELAERVCIATSVDRPDKATSPDDDGWWLAASLGFDVLSEFTGRTIAPKTGEVWLGNLYRCGGEVDAQYAAWNSVGLPAPQFHCPEHFGEFRFG